VINTSRPAYAQGANLVRRRDGNPPDSMSMRHPRSHFVAA
jgi:hypothetical protein